MLSYILLLLVVVVIFCCFVNVIFILSPKCIEGNVPVARPEEVDYLDIHYAIPRSQFAERTKLPLVLDPWSDWRVNHYTDLFAVRCQQTPVIQNVSEDGSASLGVWQKRKDSSDRYQGLPCTVSDDRLVAVTAALMRRSES
jgi:hypothetical protein